MNLLPILVFIICLVHWLKRVRRSPHVNAQCLGAAHQVLLLDFPPRHETLFYNKAVLERIDSFYTPP